MEIPAFEIQPFILPARGRKSYFVQEDGSLGLPEIEVGKGGILQAVKSLIDETGTSAVPGTIYSIFKDDESGHQHISSALNHYRQLAMYILLPLEL